MLLKIETYLNITWPRYLMPKCKQVYTHFKDRKMSNCAESHKTKQNRIKWIVLVINPWWLAFNMKKWLTSQYDWLTHAHQFLQQETLDHNDWISWAAYNAVKYGQQPRPITPSLMLLFRESAHSPMMIYHGMKVIICAVNNHINPGQNPVLVVD